VNLSNLFKQAVSLAPCIVLFDEMDVLLPNEEKDVHLQNEFLFILRAIPKGICLVCITSNIDRFDYSIRKKFDEEVFIDAPSNQERLELLKQVLPKDLNILEINAHCHGFVQADIQMIAKQVSQESTISQERVLEIVRSIRPYSLTTGDQGITDSVVEIPQVTWEQVGGLEHVKSKIIEMIVWPLQHAESYLRMSIKPPTGLLLYGPPGTGKTMIAKAIATAASANFIAINIPDLIKAEVGESEKTLANVFRRAKLASPCVLFFDEIQAMFGKRSEISRHQQKLVSQLMLELDGIEKSSMRVVLVAATNVPQSLDPSLLRPGRLENILYVGPPDRHARKSIWEMTIGKMKVTDAVKKQIDFIPNAFEQETISFSFDFSNAQETFSKKKASFVDRSEGFTGADIVNLCQHAGLNALIESMDVEAIDLRHFEKAFELFRPSVTKKMIRFYEKFKVDKT
jgi:SpoVK/Ycf46/Vps4 family AAA+-type ATPase